MTSICSVTGDKAYYTKSISNKKLKIKIGTNKTYTVLCRNEFYKKKYRINWFIHLFICLIVHLIYYQFPSQVKKTKHFV